MLNVEKETVSQGNYKRPFDESENIYSRLPGGYTELKFVGIQQGVSQGFPNWGTCTPRGTFRLLKGYIIA